MTSMFHSKKYLGVYFSLEELATTFPFVDEDAEYQWPLNREFERKLEECATNTKINVLSLDEFILDDLCFEIPEGSMTLSSMKLFPCHHEKLSNRQVFPH